MIYLDSGATTFQKPPEVARAVAYAMTHFASVGRGGYQASMEAAEAVFDVRQKAARLLDATVEQVVFTTSATHGLNIAIKSLVSPGDHVVVSGFEHNAVMRPLYALGADVTVAGRQLFCQEDTLQAFARALENRPKVVICTHVSNVFGYILPVEAIAKLCQTYGVPFILDVSQSAGVLPISMKNLQADFLAMPGHKGLYGMQGTGILVCGNGGTPLLQGGTGSWSKGYAMPDFLPDSLEAGTQNVPGICGLGAGLDYVLQRTPEGIFRHEMGLLGKLVAELQGKTPYKLYHGKDQSGALSLELPGVDCEVVAQALGQEGIAVRSGLHCAPCAHESGGTLDRGTVRLSFSDFNTKAEIATAVDVLQKMAKTLL